MKKAEIKVGGYYRAKVSGNLVTVRVDAIREVPGWVSGTRSSSHQSVYDVTNLKTGCKTTFRSAAKFRSVDPAYGLDFGKATSNSEKAWTDNGLYHTPKSFHPATCAGCTSDESKHGNPVGK